MTSFEGPWIVLGRSAARDDRGRQVHARPGDERLTEFIARAAAPLAPGESLPVFAAWTPTTSAAVRAAVAQASGSVPAEAVRLANTRWRRRAPLDLPLNIVGVGVRNEDAIERIADSDWFRRLASSESHNPELANRTRLTQLLRERPQEIVIVGPEEAPGVLREAERLPVGLRPRLVLVVGVVGERRPGWVDSLHPPHGVAVAWASASPTAAHGEYAAAVLERIAADLPLHEALRGAAERTGGLEDDPMLIADPGTNEALSFSAAAEHAIGRADAASEGIAIASLEVPLLGPVAQFEEAGLRSVRTRLLRYIVQPEEPTSGYSLHDLAAAPELLEQAREIGEQARSGAKEAGPEQLETEQVRRVDLTVRVKGRRVPGGLPAGARVRVLVRIGRPFPDSRIAGTPPPPTLPAPDAEGGHDLDVVVYGLDFRVEGKISRRLRLPRVGPSKLLSIPVLTPSLELEQAHLRVAIYCRAHLVQSFLLTATVSEDRRGEAPKFELEFGQTERFGNLDVLRQRLASLAVNDGPGASHTLMVKGAGQAGDVELNSSLLMEFVNSFRTELGRITDAITEPRVAQDLFPSADPDEQSQFADQWRDLAELGARLYREMIDRLPPETSPIKEQIRQAHGDEIIQVVRLDPSFAYPWTLLYDWDSPYEVGGKKQPFCFGNAPATTDDEPVTARRCEHGPDSREYCIYGFWGVRLRLEQLVKHVLAADPPDRVSTGCPLRLGLGDQHAGTDGLPERLKTLTTVNRMDGADIDLADDLWRDDWRPAEIVAIGHRAEAEVPDEPTGSRIKLDGRWLTMQELNVRVRKQWQAPNSIVLLLACNTTTTDPARLDDFAWRFLQARAGAVVATEIPIYGDFAARCAYLITRSLFTDRDPFATAIRDLHRRFAHAGNPLAFSLLNLGHAELTIAN